MSITIQDLQAEAIRLIDLEIKILQQMEEAPGVLIDDSQQKQTFNKESTKKRIEILEGERKKVQKLEAVIAVVGTMKAGKSTTINAIIGSEILPNRELAMTAIPTLIRHTIGQIEPILEFNHKTPVDNLLSKIIKFANDKKNASAIEYLKKSPLTKESISWILNSTKSKDDYKSKYTGTNEIFSFLKKLNDLVRISKEIGIEFPFNEYKDIDKIPVINVEFFSLKEFNQTHGQLTLLDTPGPDEYGQEHLKPMLQDQLRKSSAVLTVLDYTHLNSNSNVDVNNEIKEIASIAENRLYAILNKFDNKDANSQKPEDIINFVANDLMGGIIPKNHIFTVSSKYAYLANRARHELSKNSQLPNYENEDGSWVEDFGDKAFGSRWKKYINNIAEVKDVANEIWKNSLFDNVLKNVIEASHKEAPRLAIASASSQIKSVSTDLGNFFSVMTGSLTKDIKELQEQASELDTQIKKIESTKINISNHLEKTIHNLDLQISNKITNTRNELLSEITSLFKKGKDIESEEYEKAIAILSKKKSRKSGPLNIVVKAVDDLLNKDKEKILFKPNASIIRIEDKQKAEELIKEISESISGKIQLSGVWLKNQVALSIENLTDEFSNIVEEELKNTISNTEKSMNKSGFFIKLTPPEIEEDSLISIKIKISDVNINKKQETYTYEAWEGGWFNNILNKINSNWGYTTKTSTRDYFEVDINSIRNKIEKGIELIFSQVNTSVSQSIKQPLQESSEEYFQNLKEQIEKIQEDILQSMENKRKSEDYQSSLLTKLIEIQKPLLDLSADSEELSKAIKEYKQ
ncbi:dynamin family protein [Macromonas bipunctata]|uniref:dynamin family protein n=1 Tax=Macromonas bipunctata TaxID=183670 RepID=UPI000C33A998|nr:dynamin family protein [Macromonas bipunctata]